MRRARQGMAWALWGAAAAVLLAGLALELLAGGLCRLGEWVTPAGRRAPQ